MPFTIKVEDKVTVSLDSKKGTVTGRVCKKGASYFVKLTHSTYPLTQKQKAQIAQRLGEKYYHQFAGQHDHLLPEA